MFKTAVVLLSLLWASLLLVSWSGGEQGQQLTQTAIAAQPDL
jgi:predicted glycosyltransferase